MTRLMRLALWIGHSGTSAVIAEQFGTAMIPLCSRIRPALISGITSGTFGSMRKAEDLSITTAPALTAAGENFRDVLLPAENSAMSTPSNDCSVSSSITILSPRKSMVLPAERALASALSLRAGKARLSLVAMNSAPTAPVTPAMATTGSWLTGLSSLVEHHGLRAIKKPRSFSGGASVQIMRSFDYARTAPEPPEGALVFVVVLVEIVMARTYAAELDRGQRVLDGKSLQTGLNGVALSRHKLTHEPPQPFRASRH